MSKDNKCYNEGNCTEPTTKFLDFKENSTEIKQIAEALSSDTRIKILKAIRAKPESNHQEIAETIKMSESSITHHIRYLLDCGIIVEESHKGTKGRLKKVPVLKITKLVISL